MKSFGRALTDHSLQLVRDRLETLQINVGYQCNMACGHCHLEAGPSRKEMMSEQTADDLIAFAKKFSFGTIDITGGAPELLPHIEYLLEQLAKHTPRLILRSNLTVLEDHKRSAEIIDVCRKNRVVLVTSFPSINEAQTKSQRGDGTFVTTINMLKKLNEIGYGRQGSGLELNLVANPTGAFLPQGQDQTEKRFRQVLKNKWSIEFNNLFAFANVPLGRFKKWLERSGNFEGYLEKLASSFNPCAIDGVMCRTLISVSWDGYLYDCDFNLAADIPLGRKRIHVSQVDKLPEKGSQIAVADHCYTCTAGAGFT